MSILVTQEKDDVHAQVGKHRLSKASKVRALPKFWVTVNPTSTRGADYAHHSTMGLVWIKFVVAAL